jgi:hypothetical protein
MNVGVTKHYVILQNGALRRKLQSKAEALLILSKELDVCRKERDQFQLMAEQLQHRYTALKKSNTYGQVRMSINYTQCLWAGENVNKLYTMLMSR